MFTCSKGWVQILKAVKYQKLYMFCHPSFISLYAWLNNPKWGIVTSQVCTFLESTGQQHLVQVHSGHPGKYLQVPDVGSSSSHLHESKTGDYCKRISHFLFFLLVHVNAEQPQTENMNSGPKTNHILPVTFHLQRVPSHNLFLSHVV